MTSNTFEPTPPDPQPGRRWLRAALLLIAHGPLPFSVVAVLGLAVDWIVLEFLGDRTDLYRSIDILFVGMFPLFATIIFFACRITDVGFQRAFEQLRGRSLVPIVLSCAILVAINYSVALLSRLPPHVPAQGLLLDDMTFGAWLFFIFFGEFTIPNLIFLGLDFRLSWNLNNAGCDVLPGRKLPGLMPSALCLALISPRSLYGLPALFGMVFIVAYVYVAWREIFERKKGLQKQPHAVAPPALTSRS